MALRAPARCLLLAGICLAGCTVGPDFQRPPTASPSIWGSEPQDVGSRTNPGPVDPSWWTSFHDPELTALVGRLVAQNLDLAAAAERVRQAQAQRQVVRSAGLPHVDATAQYTHTRQSPNGFVSLVEPVPDAPLEYDLYQDNIQASWQLDLFGRVRRSVEAAGAARDEAVEARHEIALSAIAELAQGYMALRGAQAREAITRHDLELTEGNLKLVQDRLDNGVGTKLDLAQARSAVAAVQAELPPLHSAEARLINAIGLLLAEAPRTLEAELSPPAAQPPVPPTVPLGLPSTLVLRRPDVRRAEAALHQATAQTGVAVAQFYPDVSLVGQFGMQGLAFANAFSLPSRAAEVGPSIDLPLFEGGRLRATLRLRKSEQREAAIRYRSVVLQAWADVDNALTAYADDQRQQDQLQAQVEQAQVALGASRDNFRQGSSDFLNVITAQSSLLRSQDALAESRTRIETDLVALYRALGGGWQVVDHPAAAGRDAG